MHMMKAGTPGEANAMGHQLQAPVEGPAGLDLGSGLGLGQNQSSWICAPQAEKANEKRCEERACPRQLSTNSKVTSHYERGLTPRRRIC